MPKDGNDPPVLEILSLKHVFLYKNINSKNGHYLINVKFATIRGSSDFTIDIYVQNNPENMCRTAWWWF